MGINIRRIKKVVVNIKAKSFKGKTGSLLLTGWLLTGARRFSGTTTPEDGSSVTFQRRLLSERSFWGELSREHVSLLRSGHMAV